MRRLFVRAVNFFRVPIDLILAILAVPCGLVLLAYRRLGSRRFPWTTKVLRKIGVFPIFKHYYEPLFDISHLSSPLSNDRNLPGIDLNEAGQVKMLQRLDYAQELVAMKLNQEPKHLEDFWMHNPTFPPGDAEYLYQFLRMLKPRKVIEIGCGSSTKIARLALAKNRANGTLATHICIEPYELPWLHDLADIELIRLRLEDCDMDWAQALESNDLLFIDSSHIIRPQGDVLKEFLEILPRLATGVYIHIHDMFTPRDYPHDWLEEDVRFWNEQYLVEALLSNTNRYEVIGGVNFLKRHHYEKMKQVCPYMHLTPEREPSSFYLRVR